MTDIGLTLPPLPPAPETPRVFLVVVDDSQEMQLALFYACLRARRTGGRVALLQVLEPSEFQHWMSVGDLMRDVGLDLEERPEIEIAVIVLGPDLPSVQLH